MREFPYPEPTHPDLGAAVYVLHAALLITALLPLIGLFVQARRPATQGDEWLWIGCMICFPLPFVIAFRLLPDHARPFLIGLLIFAEFVSLIAVVVTSGRLRRHRNAIHPVWVLGGLLAAALLVLMLTPAVPAAREAAKRMSCLNNLKQLMLTVHNYTDIHRALPTPASRQNEVETSWRVDLLPYLEQERLRERYDSNHAWDSPVNHPLAQVRARVMTCPSNELPRDTQGRWFSAYAILLGPDSPFATQQRRSRGFNHPAGAWNIMAIVEACGQNIIWTEPRDVDLTELPLGINLPGKRPNTSYGVLSSHHPDGAQVGMLDGSVRYLGKDIDPGVLHQLTGVPPPDQP